jgi:hypothetical protein
MKHSTAKRRATKQGIKVRNTLTDTSNNVVHRAEHVAHSVVGTASDVVSTLSNKVQRTKHVVAGFFGGLVLGEPATLSTTKPRAKRKPRSLTV